MVYELSPLNQLVSMRNNPLPRLDVAVGDIVSYSPGDAPEAKEWVVTESNEYNFMIESLLPCTTPIRLIQKTSMAATKDMHIVCRLEL